MVYVLAPTITLANEDATNIWQGSFLTYITITYLIVFVTSSVIKITKAKAKAAHFEQIAQRKRTERDQQVKQLNIPNVDVSPELQEKILNSDATGLLEMLKAEEATSEQILIIYARRAFTIGLEYRLITETAFNEALVQARECDRLRKENPSACQGELFGLPITLKDGFLLKGTDASGGLACRVFKPTTEDGLLVKVLKAEGAIPFVKSNIPQAMMITETNSHIWGQAENPWKKGRGIGGSSGGEAALLAARCAPLGLGTDIAGSIRVPALHCGVFGLKPSAERVTLRGATSIAPSLGNILNLRIATGPIAKSVRDVNKLMKVLVNSKAFETATVTEQDLYYIKKEWKEELALKESKGLRIGYFRSLDLFPACPTTLRAVDEAVEALKRAGHEVFEVNFPNMDDIILTFFEIISAEGGLQFLMDALEGEAPISDYRKLIAGAKLPNILRKPAKILLSLMGEKRVGLMIERARKLSAHEFLKLVDRQTQVRGEFYKVWEEKKLDALLAPGYGHPGQKHGHFEHIVLGACYTWIFNVLNVSVGVLPVTLVKEGENNYPRGNTNYYDNIFKKTAETMEGSVGLPLGVQIVTLPFQEEKCVSIMFQLEHELQFVKKHPYPI